MIMRTIEATDDEITVLRQLIHRAVLHSGMDAAEMAIHWNRKLLVAMQETPAQVTNPLNERMS